jgi:DNA-binding GntR family transcriptional regulator
MGERATSAEAGDTHHNLSLRDRAYIEIKRRINCLDFRPGDYLNEARISRTLRIGRTPVHQALDRLMLEGLVQVIPRKGVVVQPISLDQVLHILEMRLLNESYCVALAAERASPQQIDRMRAVLHSASQLIKSRNREQLMNFDRAFHHQITTAAQNPILSDVITMLHERSLRFWFISMSDDLQLRRIHQEHRDILEAIVRRDGEAASKAMRAHIESSRQHITRAI